MCRWIKRTYDDPEVFITENGWSDDGQLMDIDRVEYYRLHLEEILAAVLNNESNLKAYTGLSCRIICKYLCAKKMCYFCFILLLAWSFLDSFEWKRGFT